jgi:hypothetical protein
MTWSGYWTPLRYVLLAKLNFLFSRELKKLAWEARLCSRDKEADTKVIYICEQLITRLGRLDDSRSRELFLDVLVWAKNNVRQLIFNAKSKRDKKFISPNLIGFQSVYWGITKRAKKKNKKVLGIIVDQQDQFNTTQDYLLQIYRNAEGFYYKHDFGLGGMDFSQMQNMFQFRNGGDIKEIGGNTHENGGTPLDINGDGVAEIEAEVNETTDGQFIFSNRLKPQGSKKSFADISKTIENKYKKE